MKKNTNILCWVVTEGMAGTENQCIGVAECLGVVPRIIRSGLKQPWATFSPWLGLEAACTFQEKLEPPWPDLLITSGRKAIAAARYVKKQSAGKTFTLHLQDPRVSPDQFDLVAVPYHDPTRGGNVIVTSTAPNKINGEKLAAAKKEFPQFGQLNSPRVAVMIGGKSKAYEMSRQTVENLIGQLKTLQSDKNTSLMITASRRTGEENMVLLKEAFPNDGQTYFWDGRGENPYIAFLAWADYILVTADSVSMVSDALSTGKPTYIIPLEGGAKRIDLFHHHILERGYVRVFDGKLEPYEYQSVHEAQNIADVVRNKMGIPHE